MFNRLVDSLVTIMDGQGTVRFPVQTVEDAMTVALAIVERKADQVARGERPAPDTRIRTSAEYAEYLKKFPMDDPRR